MRRRDFVALGAASALFPGIAFARQLRPIGVGRVVVDPRIELMSVVHLLGGYFLSSEADTAYRRDAITHFSAMRSHPIVDLAKRLAEDSLSYDRVPDFLLRLTGPDALAWRGDLQSGAPTGIPGETERSQFVSLLRDFSQVSRFGTFFARHRRLYRQVARVIEPLVEPNVVALEAYAGASLGHWQVIAGMMLHDGGFGPRLARRDGAIETYALVGPLYNSTGNPDFGDYDRLQDLIVHEFAHSLINPVTERYPALVREHAGRFEPLREVMRRRGGYNSWEIVVNEHIVRAVTARIAGLRLGQAAADTAIAREVERGFVYVPALIERLRNYEADRRAWPTLHAFYPRLLAAFGQEAGSAAN